MIWAAAVDEQISRVVAAPPREQWLALHGLAHAVERAPVRVRRVLRHLIASARQAGPAEIVELALDARMALERDHA